MRARQVLPLLVAVGCGGLDAPETSVTARALECLRVDSQALDFGEVLVSCGVARRTTLVQNTCGFPVALGPVDVESEFFGILRQPESTHELSPGEVVSIELGYAPTELGAGQAELRVGAQIVALEGEGVTGRSQTDRWTGPTPARPVDILFVIDDAPTTPTQREYLEMNLRDFVLFSTAQRLDFRLAVTTTDMERVQGGFVPVGAPVVLEAGATPDAVVALLPETFSGSLTRQPLEAAVTALSSERLAGRNAGFLRKDAILAIVVVTRGRDQSPRALPAYEYALRSLKGFRAPRSFSFSVIGGGERGCRSRYAVAPATPRLLALAEHTGGVSQSICTVDWSRTLESASRLSFGFRSRYFLTKHPSISTLEVSIDGAPLPRRESSGRQNWAYDSSTNSLNFTPLAIPPPRAKIEAAYTTAECL